MAAGFTIYFEAGVCDLSAAVRSLADFGLTVVRHEGHVTVSRPDSPEFSVSLSTGPRVREEAAEIGAGTPHEAAMRACDARFEVSFESLDAVLDEINTLIEVQVALQSACNGFLFLPWNGNLSGPND